MHTHSYRHTDMCILQPYSIAIRLSEHPELVSCAAQTVESDKHQLLPKTGPLFPNITNMGGINTFGQCELVVPLEHGAHVFIVQ